MKSSSGQVKVVTSAAGGNFRRRRFIYFVFLAALAIGFLVELSTYEILSLSDIRQAIVNIPNRWSQTRRKYGDGFLEEQSENETVIIELSTSTKRPSTELWEEATLLNLHNFSWILNNERICELSENDTRLMPILVHTGRSNFEERLAIRRSWGSLSIYRKWVIRLVFLLGEVRESRAKPDSNQRLEQEQRQFGDIVIGSFVDSYHNLTYKHLMGYKWILNFCSGADFVMKVDDDMFIDIMQWLDWRSDELDSENNDAKISDIFCHTFRGTQPIREIWNKWYASPEDWPEPDYPDYCSGWAYALEVDLIRKIYLSSNDRKMFWVDDVFVTGALMEVAKKKFNFKPEVRHIWGNVTGDIKEYRPMCENGTMLESKREFKAVVYVERERVELFERDMMCMWNKTLYDRRKLNFSLSTNGS